MTSLPANDWKYFGEIDKQLHEEGGLAGLMHHLMNFNLASVDVYTPPKTRALLEQKEESAPAHVQWWLETLERGTIRYPSDDPLDRGKILETDRVPWSGVVGVVDHRAIAGLRRVDQPASAGRLTAASSLTGIMVSSVM